MNVLRRGGHFFFRRKAFFCRTMSDRLNAPSWAHGLFEEIAKGEAPSHKIYEDDVVFAFLDINPLSKGHSLVIPKKQVTFLDEMDDETAASIGKVLPRIARAIMKVTGAKCYNVLQNNGSMAHQVVPHVHFHIIPKYSKEDGLGVGWDASKPLKEDVTDLKKSIASQIEAESKKTSGKI